jgi:hypothetical protein
LARVLCDVSLTFWLVLRDCAISLPLPPLGFIVGSTVFETIEEGELNRTDDLPPQVMHALKAGRKVEAIKLLREARGIGLLEAKEAVDSVEFGQPHVATPHRAAARNDNGVGRLVLVFAVLGACLAAYFFLAGG